jgi:hypothetical protein
MYSKGLNKSDNLFNICLGKDQAEREATYKIADKIAKASIAIEAKVITLP